MGGSAGYVRYTSLVGEDFGTLESGALYVRVGDGGSDLHKSIVTLCSPPGDAYLRVEKSETIGDTVTWKPYD